LPITLNWSDSRYELGLFRLSRRQVLYDEHYPNGRLMADPYWGLSLSRRWRIFTRGPIKGTFGAGILPAGLPTKGLLLKTPVVDSVAGNAPNA
jgi:hypothetical protein